MKNKNFKILIAISTIFLFLAVLPLSSVYAEGGLEIKYPEITSTGSSLTSSDTPLPNYLKYIFDIGMFLGFFAVFLSIVAAGVLYLFSAASGRARTLAKEIISGAMSGLIIFVTLYLIITTLNPYLAIFKLGKMEGAVITTDNSKEAGVYFHNSNNCSGNAPANTRDILDLGDLRNSVNSVSIIHKPALSLYYIGILFDETNNWGQCKYIDPNSGCSSKSDFVVEPSSASIHKYRYKKYGDAYKITLNRGDGASTYISGSAIENAGIYIKKLEDIKFYYPPGDYTNEKDDLDKCTAEDLDCIGYDQNKNCYKKKCPDASADNIASISFDGKYFLVMLVYFDPITDAKYGPWTYCQVFSTPKDINKRGPQEVKWESIRQTGKYPNWLIIIPIGD